MSIVALAGVVGLVGACVLSALRPGARARPPGIRHIPWAARPTGGPGRGHGRGAHWATARELSALRVSVRSGHRLVVGTVVGRSGRRGWSGRLGWRQIGPRGLLAVEAGQSLAVVGPTQSGKTTALAVPAILGWDGPVLAASVKSDLLVHTVAWRRTRGPTWVLDPAGATGAPSMVWSPLRAAASWPGARRMAAALVESAQGDGTTADGEFWYAMAAKTLAPLLLAASVSGGSMTDVLRWVDTQEVAEVSEILERAGAQEALQAARAGWLRGRAPT